MTTATESYSLRRQVHALVSQGYGYKRISARLGLSRTAVRHHAASALPSYSPASVIAAACALKAEEANKHMGPCQLLDKLCEQWGCMRADLGVSETALGRSPEYRRLVKPGTCRKGKRKLSYSLDEYDRPGRVYQIDTVKLVLSDGVQVECLTVVDVVSRAAWAEVLPRDGSICWCLKRAFDALGVPEVISTDNGAGFSLDTPTRLSEVVRYCFQAGVKRFAFIPVASPWYNGNVEAWHKTMKRGAWLHEGRKACLTPEDVPGWLRQWLSWYNIHKSHHSLGGKGNRRKPAQVHGSFNLLDVAPHDFRFGAGDEDPTEGVVSFVRRAASNGLCRIDAPSMLLSVPTESAFGRLLRFDFNIADGSGVVLMFPDDDPNRPQQIGTFRHALTGSAVKVKAARSKKARAAQLATARPGADGFIQIQLQPGVVLVPVPFDEVQQLESERRHLKKGLRRPLPPGYRYAYDEVGDRVVLDRYGRVRTTAWHRVLDHLAEVLGDGWGCE